ncbi:MAG: DICT sensory domain-containing protein, partial [Cyanobacteria bacterium P01_H01_bin.121]
MLEGSILQKLQLAHSGQQRPLKFGVYFKNTLVSLCHALEDYVLHDASQPLIISAFQQGKWYLQEAERYSTMAERARHVVIMAQSDAGFIDHPTSQQANVDLVDLNAADPVAQEWHLIILAPTYTAMVLCQELSDADYGPAGQPEQDLERKFYGFWTFETDLVQETVDLAIAHISHYRPELAQQLQQHRDQVERSPASFEDLNVVVTRVVDYLRQGQQQLDLHRHVDVAPVFRYKALDRNLVSNEVQAFLRMAELLDQTDNDNPYASVEVATLSEAMAELLDLPAWQLRRLRLAALLHRLDPLRSIAESDLVDPETDTQIDDQIDDQI